MKFPDRPTAIVAAGNRLADELRSAIEETGFTVLPAASAREAIALLEHGAHVVIVDTTAAEFDGVAAVRAIKANLDQFVPIIAMCPLGDAAGKRRAVEAGVDDLATVPVSDNELSLRLHANLQLCRMATQLERVSAELSQSTVTDSLTALYNERAMRNFLTREYARARRYRRTLSLLIVDVDGLHRINEVQGRDAGDLMLTDVADLIRREVRECDWAGRVDGTFWILAPETDGESVMAMAERLRRAAKQATNATVSIGVATMPAVMAASADALQSLAQTALRRAKAEGRNCCRSAE